VKRATVEQRRIEILETTCQVVVERGFAATRVSDVASRLGVSTGLIHYHFDSKEMLLAEALRYAAEQDITRLEQELEQAHTALTQLDTMFSFDMPEAASAENSRKGVPRSSSRSIRSRTGSLPRERCRSRYLAPPPSRLRLVRARSSSTRLRIRSSLALKTGSEGSMRDSRTCIYQPQQSVL